MLSILLMLGVAMGADCDAKALRASVTEASPVAVPAAFIALANCDAKAALGAAKVAIPRVLAGSDSNQAIARAITLGAGSEVQAWLQTLEPDQRSRTLGWLGEQCADQPAIADFFVSAHDTLGDVFWEQRWHRGLATCRTPTVQALLSKALEDPGVGAKSTERARFFSLLEVYARNLGGAALPLLDGLVASSQDPKETTLMLPLYADAANVGGVDGTDPDVAAKAVASLHKAAPNLPAEAMDQARDTLKSLGADELSDQLARYRFPEAFVDGHYTYAAVATERVSCKNGKTQRWFHSGLIIDDGSHWPDQLRPLLSERLREGWGLTAAEKCKGEGEVVVEMSKAPINSAQIPEDWLRPRLQAFRTEAKAAAKSGEQVEETLNF